MIGDGVKVVVNSWKPLDQSRSGYRREFNGRQLEGAPKSITRLIPRRPIVKEMSASFFSLG